MSKMRKCKHCGKRIPVEEGVQTPASFFCSFDCCYEYAKLQAAKAVERKKSKAKRMQRQEDAAARKRQRERKDAVKPLKWYADRAQAEFNKFIRLRDAGKPCVSCGKPDNGQHQRHASHYRSRGGCSSLRFDEANVHASCSQCNNYLSGNIEGYTPELIARVGESEFNRINSAPKSKTWTKDELISIYEKYKEKNKNI